MAGVNNIVNIPGVVDKIRQTKLNTIINGKNLDTISAERAADTMKKEFLDETGNITTIYKQNGKKISDYYKTQTTLPDGTITTLGSVKASKTIKLLRDKSKMYVLKNIFDDTYIKHIPAYELRKLCANLHLKTKENYLGMSLCGETILRKTNRTHLIGLYVEEL